MPNMGHPFMQTYVRLSLSDMHDFSLCDRQTFYLKIIFAIYQMSLM